MVGLDLGVVSYIWRREEDFDWKKTNIDWQTGSELEMR